MERTVSELEWVTLHAAAERVTELRAALLAVILAYDDNDDASDPEKTLSDAIQAARAAWRGASHRQNKCPHAAAQGQEHVAA